jgi:hypothetical protein
LVLFYNFKKSDILSRLKLFDLTFKPFYKHCNNAFVISFAF